MIITLDDLNRHAEAMRSLSENELLVVLSLVRMKKSSASWPYNYKTKRSELINNGLLYAISDEDAISQLPDDAFDICTGNPDTRFRRV